ncbi:MAG: hypothetical protein OXI32_03275 [bacterium]|nr:hypothetical protein [bacterium]
MSPHDVLLERSAKAFGFGGRLVRLALPDGHVHLSVDLDEGEHLRRSRAGLGAITDWELVAAMWELPHAVAVPQSSIPSEVLAVIEQAPVSAVELAGGSVLRKSCPPLTVSGAFVVGDKLERLLRRVGQMSAIASMAVVVRREVDPSDPWMLNAALYGVGVAVSAHGDLTPVSEPEPVTPTLGPFMWWVAEKAYEQVAGAVR